MNCVSVGRRRGDRSGPPGSLRSAPGRRWSLPRSGRRHVYEALLDFGGLAVGRLDRLGIRCREVEAQHLPPGTSDSTQCVTFTVFTRADSVWRATVAKSEAADLHGLSPSWNGGPAVLRMKLAGIPGRT